MIKSLKYRIAGTIFFLEAIMMTIVLWQTLSHTIDKSKEQIEYTERATLELAAEVSRIALFTEEFEVVQRYVEKLSQFPLVLRVILLDDRNIIVASQNFKNLGEKLPELRSGENSYWREYDIKNPSGQYGKLLIEFSSLALSTTYQEAMNLGIVIAVVGMIIIAMTGVIIGSLLTRRLKVVVDATEQISSGNFDIRVNLSGNDEISQLGNTFEAMAVTISNDRKQLASYNAELEKRVNERTRELSDANQEYESFAYSISHDLRTPLRALNGYSQILLDDYVNKIDSDGINYLTRIQSASIRMGDLIDGLLELSRINRKTVDVKPIDLSSMCQSIIHDLSVSDPNRDVEFVLQPNVNTKGDPSLIYNLLQNLIGNSWKFTQPINNARIEFKTQNENGTVIYVVKDNGVGFDLAYASNLFKPFHRLHAIDEFEGTGIGLSTVKRITQRHQGRVWADSSPGKGAEFYFCLYTELDSSFN